MLQSVTLQILEQLPEETRLTNLDIKVIKDHKGFIFDKVDAVVKDFYDTVFANAATAAVFHEGERPAREQSMKEWIVKTVEGDFDIDYWKWQTFVGILHVKRKVKNNMMIAMMGRISDLISTAAIEELPPQDAIALKTAWSKLASTVLALIAESYHIFYKKAITDTSGLSDKLLENTVAIEIDNLINEFRKHRI